MVKGFETMPKSNKQLFENLPIEIFAELRKIKMEIIICFLRTTSFEQFINDFIYNPHVENKLLCNTIFR